MDPHSFYLGIVAGVIGTFVVSIIALVILTHLTPIERVTHE